VKLRLDVTGYNVNMDVIVAAVGGSFVALTAAEQICIDCHCFDLFLTDSSAPLARLVEALPRLKRFEFRMHGLSRLSGTFAVDVLEAGHRHPTLSVLNISVHRPGDTTPQVRLPSLPVSRGLGRLYVDVMTLDQLMARNTFFDTVTDLTLYTALHTSPEAFRTVMRRMLPQLHPGGDLSVDRCPSSDDWPCWRTPCTRRRSTSSPCWRSRMSVFHRWSRWF
jgi:hypothetical protein